MTQGLAFVLLKMSNVVLFHKREPRTAVCVVKITELTQTHQPVNKNDDRPHGSDRRSVRHWFESVRYTALPCCSASAYNCSHYSPRLVSPVTHKWTKMTQHISLSCSLNSGAGKIPRFPPFIKNTAKLSENAAL